MSDDADYMASQVSSGLDLHIVGVVKPNGSGGSNALSPGVAYTHGLTTELMAPTSTSSRVSPSTRSRRTQRRASTSRACSRSTRTR